MTDMCEIAESLGTCTSTTSATTAVMVSEVGAATSRVLLGVTLGLASAGAGVSTADPSSYALLRSTAATTSTVSSAAVLTNIENSRATAANRMVVAMPLSLSSSGAATSAAYPELPPPVLESTGVAASTTVERLVFAQTLASAGVGSSVLTSYHAETAEADAAAASSVVLGLVANATLSSTGAGASTVLASNVPTLPILESLGVGSSSLTARTDWVVVAETDAVAYSAVYFKDPGRVAWVLNTESTAASWYTNFDLQSIAQVDDSVFAVGSEGVFELTGDDDAGDVVDASIRTGFMDFGNSHVKRLENVYFGYISTGILGTLLRVLDSGHAATQFYLEERSAGAPRNSRVVPGKGLFGRYWQIEINNVNGADFTVYDVEIDVASSQRKF